MTIDAGGGTFAEIDLLLYMGLCMTMEHDGGENCYANSPTSLFAESPLVREVGWLCK